MTTASRVPVDQAARDMIRDHSHSTLFVEAGAGTGKTTALVARVVEMIAVGRLPRMQALAAITFTENAAAELRNRIREALEQAARGSMGERMYDQEQAARCAVALRELDDAAITTLHGFAARILSDVPLEAGLPPGFAVSDAITAQLGAAKAWQRFLDDLLDDASVTPQVLAGLTLELKLDRLRAIAGEFAANWDQLEGLPFTDKPLPSIDTAPVLQPLRRATALAVDGPEGDKLTDYLADTVRPAALELASFEEPLDLLDVINRLDIKWGYGSAPAWDAVGLSKADVVADLKEAAQARATLLAEIGDSVTETLCARVQTFTLAEARRRQAEGRLDFHDLLVLTRDVLRLDPDVRKRLHERSQVVLIDEFQDTDPLQVEIACLIAGKYAHAAPGEWSTIPIPSGRLFFVGDPKQSIYRFRRADVGLFTQVGALHARGRTRLDVNFRSVPGVIDAVNAVFGDLIGGASDAQVPYADLMSHRANGGGGPPVTVLGGPLDSSAAELRELEAAHIAAVITQVKGDGWLIGDPSDGKRASYADIAILLPTRTSLPALESALQGADIPYRVESRSLVWATDAVWDLVTMLQAIANPADEVAVVAALRHHGLACSDVDLVAWTTAGGRWSFLAQQLPDGVPSDHPVALGMETLKRWHNLRWWLPVNHLLDRIVRELRLVELTAELRRPRDHWRRIRFLVDQARAFCDSGGSGLSDFVAWAVDQIESEADVLETVVPEPDDDAVRILTVHGAKGLEFPVTIVAGLGVGHRSASDVLWEGPRPEVRLLSGALETLLYRDQQAAEKPLDQAEAIRLLYVAMTRAKDYLLLGCYHKPVGGEGSRAQQLWRLLETSPLASVQLYPPALAAREVSSLEVSITGDRQTAMSARAALLAGVKSRVATSATELVADAAVAPPTSTTSHRESAVPPQPATEPNAKAVRRYRVSRTGAAIGTAVHGVLELVSLTDATPDEVRRLSQVACQGEEIPLLVADIVSRVGTALQSAVIADAGASGRYWREVYVVSREDDRFLEGYIDLLVVSADELLVVDYKTDRAATEPEIQAKAQHFRPQLQVYASAIERGIGVRPAAGLLLFLSAEAARSTLVSLDGNSPSTTGNG
jgi:ATP-dependent helicase/nuclease subunit A